MGNPRAVPFENSPRVFVLRIGFSASPHQYLGYFLVLCWCSAYCHQGVWL